MPSLAPTELFPATGNPAPFSIVVNIKAFGVDFREHVQRTAGFTQETPGISLINSHARLRSHKDDRQG